MNHGEIWKESAAKSKESDARAQARNVKERTVGEKSDEPQTSDCYRSLGGSPGRRQGSAQEKEEVINARPSSGDEVFRFPNSPCIVCSSRLTRFLFQPAAHFHLPLNSSSRPLFWAAFTCSRFLIFLAPMPVADLRAPVDKGQARDVSEIWAALQRPKRLL